MKTKVPQEMREVLPAEAPPRRVRVERAVEVDAVEALKSALLELLARDQEVRAAVLEIYPLPVAAAAVAAQLQVGDSAPDAERARFVVDLIESYVGRHVRPDALRRPLR